jgi:hypothetical protein
MDQADLTKRYESTKEVLANLKDECSTFLYATQTKFIPKIGYVHELSITEVLKAKRFLNKLNETQFSVEMKELGITDSELGETPTNKYLGVKLKSWITDLGTRVDQLRSDAKINTLTQDLLILERNLDASSRRDMDLSKLSSVEL